MNDNKYNELKDRIEKIEKVVFGKKESELSHIPDDTKALNWKLNERAFIYQYAGGKSGTAKFVLVLAFLTKGDVNKEVALKEIQALWGKMTAASLLGMKFNRKYPTEAKTKGWVNSASSGKYQLSLGWQEILNEPKST